MISISMILLAVAAVIILLCAGVSALRGFGKTVLRTATILLSALIALITCWIFKGQLPDAAGIVAWMEANAETIRQVVGDAEVIETLKELSNVSPTLVELIVQLLVALVAPLLCLILFILCCLVTGIIYFIVKLILRGLLKKFNKLIPLSRLCAAGVGVIEGIIIVGMLFLPVTAYMSVLSPAMDGLVEQGVMDPADPDTQTVLDIVEEIDAAPALQIHRVLGGDLVADSLMSVKVAGEKVNLEEELDPILAMLNSLTELGETEMQNYGEREAELIRALGTSFRDSKLLAPIVGDVLFAATDAWQNGEDFLGAEKPSMGEGEGGELLDPFLDTLLDILHDDAKTPDLLSADIETLADVISILVEKDVMNKLQNPEEMRTVLGGDGFVKAMIDTLETNESMKRLIPEITKIGMSAISQIVTVPEDAEETYGEFMDDIADALNDLSELSKEEQVETLTEHLNTAFEEVEVEIDKEILDLYSSTMIEEIVEKNNGELTADDVKAFFESYANGTAN